ncbi:MAG: TIGR04551 family protein [Myxococcota bacterium]
MRFFLTLAAVLQLCAASEAWAQADDGAQDDGAPVAPDDAENTQDGEESAPEADTEPDVESEEDDEDALLETPELRAPDLAMPDLAMPDISLPEEEEAEEEEPPEDETPRNLDDPSVVDYRAPETAFSFRGYMRLRGLHWRNFFISRDLPTDPSSFRYFVPADRGVVPSGGCNRPTSDPDPNPEGADACRNSEVNRFASMRLRLRPTLALSDSVRVHATLDVFDNLVLGSTPESTAFAYDEEAGEFRRVTTPGANENELFNNTQNPPQGFRNGARDAIYVRRAWAEISNPGIGQLRFGRMGSHWGLGMVHNAGDDIDGDFSTDLDRFLFATSAFGLSGYVSYDLPLNGLTRGVLQDQQIGELDDDLRGVPRDATNVDDSRQITAALAYRLTEPEAQARLREGKVVFEVGAFITAQRHNIASVRADVFGGAASFSRRNARIYTPDLWARLRWGGLRLEVEAAYQTGRLDNVTAFNAEDGAPQDYRLRQFGLAIEGEYRVPQLDDKFYVRVYTGLATGDAQLRGFSVRDEVDNGTDGTLSQFGFHPNYRVDLILWRNIMGRVAGAWYLRPGLGYDIIRSPRGRLFGLSGDVIYSRAMRQQQSYGDSPNLGVELNLAAYYRSEDGPGFFDGFYASFQYGVLFTMDGLGYRTDENGQPEIAGGNPGIGNAQTMRLILGVQY